MLTWLRKHTKTILIVVVIVFAGTMFYGLGMSKFSQGQSGMQSAGSNKLATVNGEEVSRMRFVQIFSQMAQNMGGNLAPTDYYSLENYALQQAIQFTLMLQDARRNVSVSGNEMNAAMASFLTSQKISDAAQLDQILRANKINPDDFRNMLKEDVQVQKMVMKVQNSVRVEPDDLKEVRASHILILKDTKDAKKQAESLLDQIKKGADFAALAKANSQDPGSAKNGGDLGYFAKGTMVPEFDKAVFTLKVGEISQVVESQFGYHIIKVTDTRLRQIQAPKGQKMDLNSLILRQKQMTTYQNWLRGLAQKAKIEVEDPVLKGFSLRTQGKINEALTAFLKAASQQPNNAYLQLMLAETYMVMGNSAAAEETYKKAGSVSTTDPATCMVLAAYFKQLTKSKNITNKALFEQLANEEFARASALAGDNVTMHQQLLKVFQKQGLSSLAKKEQAIISQLTLKANLTNRLISAEAK